MEAWQVVMIILGLIGYYLIGCVVANKTCSILREDADLITVALFWPIVVLSKVLTLPFKYLE